MAYERKRITDYTEATEYSNSDYLLMDNGTVTKKIKASKVGGGGGGSTITYGYINPSDSANDGDIYYLLNTSDKLQGTFLYKTNQWVLIDGYDYSSHEAVHVWTESTGMDNASVNIQHGYYDTNQSTFTADGEAVNVPYRTVQDNETTYFDFVSLYYGNWTCKAKVDDLTDGTNTYDTNDTIKTWAYNNSVDFYVYRV